MHNTAGQYVAMWRHVEGIFRQLHVHNVTWCWSPNLLIPNQPYPLRTLYPGGRYVDAVGLDGDQLLVGGFGLVVLAQKGRL